jgi:uncharacterized protein (DUF1697 family)
MRYIALLRGINVGGNKKVSMADLRELLSSLGHADVATYIQSGNALFTSARRDPAKLAQEIENRLERDLRMDVTVIVRSRDELAAVVAANPFVSRSTPLTGLHATFLSEQPDKDKLSQIDPKQFEPDEFDVGNRVIYTHLLNGYAATKLNHDLFERSLGVRATSRNWNTVTKLLDLANG